MKAHKFFPFTQSNQSVQPLHNENTTMQNYESTSVQSSEPLAQTSLLQKALVKPFDRIWQALVRSARMTQEPQIIWMRDRQGHSYFKIYDPHTRQHHYADSEQEVRIWLDCDRYQQRTQRNCSKKPLVCHFRWSQF